MSRKFKHALKELKHTYPAPDPEREAEFLRNLPPAQKKRHLPLLHNGHRTLWYSVPAIVTAAVLIAVGTGVYQNVSDNRLPTADPPAQTTTAPVTEFPSAESETPGTPETQETGAAPPVNTDMPEPEATDPIQTFVSTQLSTDGTYPSESSLTEATAVTTATGTAPQTTAVPGTASPTTTQENNAPSPSATQPPPVATEPESTEAEPTPTTNADPAPADSTEPPMPSTTPTIVPAPSTEPTTDGNEPSADDRTVLPAFRYTVTETVLENVTPPVDGPDEEEIDWKELADKADLIVWIHVDDLFYTRAGADAYTQLDVTVDAVYKGEITARGRISVYEEGGYIPLSEAKAFSSELGVLYQGYPDDTSVHFQGGTTKASAIGEGYVLFLKEADDPEIPYGAYVYADSMDTSRFTLTGVEMKSADGLVSCRLSELRAYLD